MLQKKIDSNMCEILTDNIEIRAEESVIESKRYAFYMKPLIDRDGSVIARIFSISDEVISKKRYAYVIYKICMESINNAYFSGKAKKIAVLI